MYNFSLFPDRLKKCIKEKGCTQVELAQQLGISKYTLTKYLHGRIPETTILYALAKFFNKPMEWFLTGEYSTIVPQNEMQKVEAFDPDLKMMIAVLKELMESGDPDLRGWTKIQFKSAFKEHCASQEEKKFRHDPSDGSTK